jgi:hypothetical protein
MFVQVIQGKVADAEGLKSAVEQWQRDIAPGATGWLGSTGGATADGTAISIVRFESEEDARRNSDRPEQGQWWVEASKYFAGDVTFHDCPEVITWGGGGSDDAGFVQIIQGHSTNPERSREMMSQADDAMRELRPDVLGGVVAMHADAAGDFTQVVYFTSEAAAREGEKAEPPADMQAMQEEVMSLLTDAKFYDLTNPWFFSPR